MQFFSRHASVHRLVAASVVTWLMSMSLAVGQEVRDRNAAGALESGRASSADTKFYSSGSDPQRGKLPIIFRRRDDSSATVVRGNGSANSAALPLAPPKEKKLPKPGSMGASSNKNSIATVVSSLAMVLGAFFLVAWFARRTSPRTTVALPQEVVETLGRMPLGNRQYLQLVRLGNKLLLLSVSPHATETLTEVTSADEVERLMALCQQNQPGSVTKTFRNILAQLGDEPTAPGFLGNPDEDEMEAAPVMRTRRSRLRQREEDHV